MSDSSRESSMDRLESTVRNSRVPVPDNGLRHPSFYEVDEEMGRYVEESSRKLAALIRKLLMSEERKEQVPVKEAPSAVSYPNPHVLGGVCMCQVDKRWTLPENPKILRSASTQTSEKIFDRMEKAERKRLEKPSTSKQQTETCSASKKLYQRSRSHDSSSSGWSTDPEEYTGHTWLV